MASGGFLVVALLAVLVLLALGGFVASAGLLAALLINSLIGILVLALLGFLGLHIPINILTVLVVVLFGLAGVALLSILWHFWTFTATRRLPQAGTGTTLDPRASTFFFFHPF